MSQQYLLNIWISEYDNLIKLNAEDEEFTFGGPYQDSNMVRIQLGNFIIRYSTIANRLCDIADDLKDPVENKIVRHIYELTVSRVLHLYFEFSRLMSKNIVNIDDLLLQNNLTPNNIHLKLPYYLTKERDEIAAERNKWFENFEASINQCKEENSQESQSLNSVSTENNLEVQPIHLALHEDLQEQSSGLDIKVFEKLEVVEALENISEPLKQDFDSVLQNHKSQKLIEQNYEKMYAEYVKKLRENYQSDLEENIDDEIREWFEHFFRITGDFPTYPSEETVFITGEIYGVPKKIPKELVQSTSVNKNGLNDVFSKELAGLPKLSGSALIVSNNWISPEEWNLCKNFKKSKGSAKKVMKPKSKVEIKGFTFEETSYFSIMNALKNKVLGNAESNLEHYITGKAMADLGLEARSMVDKLMREELCMTKKSGKKSKKKKSTKTKKKKKAVGALNTDECMQQLASCGVFKHGITNHMYSRYGDRICQVQEKFKDEILNQLLQRCIFPLLSSTIHYLAPLTRSICVLGPLNSGKLLLDMLITETASALFDLSPAVTAEICPGKKELKNLIDSVTKLARELQPSIIYVGDVDKVFYKKVPKHDKKLKPKRLQKYLQKLIKGLRKNDKIMVVATATEPWLSRQKPLLKCFSTWLLPPSHDYGTHSLAWNKLLHDSTQSAEISALAKTSAKEGYLYFDLETTAHKRKEEQLVEETLLELPLKQADIHSKYEKFLESTPFAIAKKKKKAAPGKQKKSKK